MDAVDYSQEVFEAIRDEYADFSAKLRPRNLTFIPISALCGDNVVHRSERMPWYDGASLLTHLESVHIASDHNLIDFRFPVQYVSRPHDMFRGYCGTVASGVVRVGDEVTVLPSGKTTRVKRIIVNRADVDHAFPPQAATICLDDEIDISRGDMLAHPANVPWAAHEIEAMLIWMSEEPLRLDGQYFVKHTTHTVRGRFTQLNYLVDPNTLHRQSAQTLQLNEIGRIGMQLFRPIFCDEYERNRQTGSFIVIDPLTNATVAAGMVIDRSHRYEAFHPAGAEVNRNITRHAGQVGMEDRVRLLGQRPATVWLTGLSGSGKSTIAYALEKRLVEQRTSMLRARWRQRAPRPEPRPGILGGRPLRKYPPRERSGEAVQ